MDGNSNHSDVQNYEVPERPPKKYGLVSMILGILSVLFVCGLNLPLGIVALVFAAEDLKQWGSFKGMALTGFITGIIGIAFASYQLYWIVGDLVSLSSYFSY